MATNSLEEIALEDNILPDTVTNADQTDSPITLLAVNNSHSYLNSTVVSSQVQQNNKQLQRKKLIKKTAKRAHWLVTAMTLALMFLSVFVNGQNIPNEFAVKEENNENSNAQLKNIVQILATLVKNSNNDKFEQKQINISPEDNLDVELEKINEYLRPAISKLTTKKSSS